MSKTNESTLSLLLKLSAGLLDETQAKSVKHKIDSDPRWKQRWLQVRECGVESENLIDDSIVDNIDPQIVGQFVEQQLPPKTARQLEAIAWQKPWLLREIVTTFQNVYLPVETGDFGSNRSDVFIDRVLGMLPAPANGYDHDLTVHDAFDGTNQGALEGHPWRYSVATFIAIATTLFLVAMLVAANLVDFADEQRLVEDTGPTRPEVERPDTVPIEDIDLPDSDERTELVADGMEDDDWNQVPSEQVVEIDAPSDDANEVANDSLVDVPEFQKFTAEDSVVESGDDDLPYSIYNPIRPHWTQYNGAIGVREPGQDVIRGYGFDDQLASETEIQVFPMSWAQADVSGLGQIVVGGDTIFRIGSRIDNSDHHNIEEQIEISLRQGRIAVVGMVPDTRILVKTGSDEWPVAVTRNDSTLVIERVADRVRLFTRRGKLRVRGKDLARNRQMTLQNGEFAKPEKTNLNTKWVDRPNSEYQLPETISERLFNSPNLTTAFGQLQNSSDDQTRIAAIQWQWTIQPIDVVKVFRTHDMTHWVYAMNWLAEQSPDQIRTRIIWRHLADGPGNPEIAREFVRWVRLRNNNGLPAPLHVKKMIEFLAHDRLFVRFASTYLLENSFGNPSGYRPQAPANVRSRTMHIWRQYIAEVYKRKVGSAVMNN